MNDTSTEPKSTESYLEQIRAEEAANLPIPDTLVASAHFLLSGENVVETGVFSPTASIGEVYRWAFTVRPKTFSGFERPSRILISPNSH